MKRHVVLFLFIALSLSPVAAHGQLVGLADDIMVISKGVTNRDTGRKTTALGSSPGSMTTSFGYQPGGRDNVFDEAPEPAHPRARIGVGRPSTL
ncbi:MAG TPA: hypothetical protein VJ783_31605, partial [Pirellulales bacterium]|nr:hypothetical protein [Pirellulales bacterium]